MSPSDSRRSHRLRTDSCRTRPSGVSALSAAGSTLSSTKRSLIEERSRTKLGLSRQSDYNDVRPCEPARECTLDAGRELDAVPGSAIPAPSEYLWPPRGVAYVYTRVTIDDHSPSTAAGGPSACPARGYGRCRVSRRRDARIGARHSIIRMGILREQARTDVQLFGAARSCQT